MLGILRKDFLLFAIGALGVFPTVLLVELLLWRELRVASLIANGVLTWLVGLLPLLANEAQEERSGGYVLLGALPVLAREIVAAKYLLLLGAVSACTLLQLAFLALAEAAPALLGMARLTALLNAAACLLVGAVAYVGIFVLGFTRFTVVALACFTALGLVPPLLLMMGRPAARELLRGTAAFLLSLNATAVVSLGLALYALLFVVSVSVFSFAPKKKYVPWG